MSTRLAALDTVSACLQVGKSTEQVAALGAAISSGKIDWQQVIGLADTTLISPSLWSELCAHHLQGQLPLPVHDYLQEIHRLNTARNQRLYEQTMEMVTTFNSLGVEPVLLKGMATIFARTYRDAGSRMLTDIDVLVPHHQAYQCWELLCTQGYSPIADGGDYSRHHHLHPLTRAGEFAVIEIHTDILMPSSTGRLLGNTLSHAHGERITQMVTAGAQAVCCDQLRLGIPCPTHRVLHCLLHAAFMEFNAYRAGTLPLKSLYELAVLQDSLKMEVNWREISAVCDEGRNTKLLRAWVYLAHRLFGSALPPAWTTTSHMRAHYTRCRLQARWGLALTFKQYKRVL